MFFWWWATEWARLKLRHRKEVRAYYARLQHESDERTAAFRVVTQMTADAAGALARRDWAEHQRLTTEIGRIRNQIEGGTPR